MHIKQHLLAQHIQKKIAPFYMLLGQEPYLLEESRLLIHSAVRARYACDALSLSIQSPQDWIHFTEETSNYSLFSEVSLISMSYDKKTLDAVGKKWITHYLDTHDARHIVILCAPHIPIKQVPWLCNHKDAVVVAAYALNESSMIQWIRHQLQKNSLHCVPQIPYLIYNYTQGNMLACAQTIEKIALSHDPHSQINEQDALEQLSDQCVYTLYELTEACLLGHAEKAIHILRHAAENKTEAVLILWILTQDIRLLLQLSFKLEHHIDFNTACSSLKIWPQRAAFYKAGMQRIRPEILEQLLHYSRFIDEQIKSNFYTQVWNSLEQLAVSLALGR